MSPYPDSFGLRLRAERERRQITLESIAATTKIGVGLLQGLERDDVSRWPGGIFRRSFVRGYASAIGLDADEVVNEFLERFPEPDEVAGQRAGTNAAPGSGVPQNGTAAGFAAAPLPPGGSHGRHAGDPRLRLTLADSWTPFVGGAVLLRARDRCAAAALDVGLMLALALVIFVIVGEFWAPLGITMLCYYVVSIISLGNTPGVCLFAPRPVHDERDPHALGSETALDYDFK